MQNITPSKFKLKFKKSAIVPAVLVIVLLAFLGTSVFIVNQAEEAVITRFGKYHTTKGPGLQFKLPFGIDHNYLVNVRAVLTEEFGFRTQQMGPRPSYSGQASESTMLTGDLNIVDVEWIMQYRISDSRAWVFNVQEQRRTIRDVSRSAINMMVGDRAIMDIMGVERSAIETAAMLFMNETFRGYDLGIDVITVKLQNVFPPLGVQEAFDDVNKAIQDLERLINEGQQAYNEVIPRARGEAEQMIQVAEGYAIARVNRANGDVARFNSVYDEYRNAPEVTRQRLYYEMIEDVFKDEDGMKIIDRNLNNFLPMMNLGAAAQQGGR